MSKAEKVVVVACAGMDKALGSVARAAAFKIEEFRPGKVKILCLTPLLAGVGNYAETIKESPVVTIDGCAERCATKLIVKSGGKIKGRILVPENVKKHNLTPKSASDIGPEGEKLAGLIASEVASVVDRLIQGA
jgi:glycine cleavage system H protein